MDYSNSMNRIYKPIPLLGLNHYTQAAEDIAEELDMTDESQLNLATKIAEAILGGNLQARDETTGLPVPIKPDMDMGFASQYVSKDDVNKWLVTQGVSYCWAPETTVVLEDSSLKTTTLEDRPESDQPANNPEMSLAELFDPVTVEVLESIFPADDKWKNWAERAKRNGLIKARDRQGFFNPYLAAEWFLKKGVSGWNWARCTRALVKTLPPRSIDEKHRLTGDYD
jgi:hypothetical protein